MISCMSRFSSTTCIYWKIYCILDTFLSHDITPVLVLDCPHDALKLPKKCRNYLHLFAFFLFAFVSGRGWRGRGGGRKPQKLFGTNIAPAEVSGVEVNCNKMFAIFLKKGSPPKCFGSFYERRSSQALKLPLPPSQ